MITIDAVAAFKDNYIWVMHQDGQALAVDPGDAAPLERFLDAHGLHLDTVLVTHHHADHTGGLARLVQRYPGLRIIGPSGIAAVTHVVADGQHITWHDRLFAVIGVPGHTLDHLAYLGDEHLFPGDTLFGAGCGRVFEGTAPMMFASLERLAALPDATRFYPAHEYTLSNLAFALAVEPDNTALRERLAHDSALRDKGLPTLPGTVGMEKRTNPFLRTHVAAVAASACREAGYHLSGPASLFAALRDWKNRF